MGNRPQINTQAPNFSLPDGDFKPVRLSDYRGKNVVLVFYPGDWSPVCTGELALFQETIDEIRAHNAQILAISVDSPHCHRSWSDHQHLSFPLLSDFWPHGAVARLYGVFREADGVSDRALFFIDANGTVRDVWVAHHIDVPPGLSIVFDALQRMEAAATAPAQHA
jgi:peroxiredoxin